LTVIPNKPKSWFVRQIIVQSTGAGTKGIVRSVKAGTMLATSLVVANTTVQFIRKLEPKAVMFVITGQYRPGHGDEDVACAEYLELLLERQQPDPAPFIERVFKSRDAIQHLDPNRPEFPLSDLDHCTVICVRFCDAGYKMDGTPCAIKP
jgi:2-phosphosulfolactate phosphatase